MGLGAGFGLGAGLGLVLVLGLGLAPPLPASLRRGSPLPASAAALFLREEAVAPTRLLMTSRVATAASLVGGSGRAIIRSRFLPTRPVASEADSSDSVPPSSPAMEVRAEATWETPSGVAAIVLMACSRALMPAWVMASFFSTEMSEITISDELVYPSPSGGAAMVAALVAALSALNSVAILPTASLDLPDLPG